MLETGFADLWHKGSRDILYSDDIYIAIACFALKTDCDTVFGGKTGLFGA